MLVFLFVNQKKTNNYVIYIFTLFFSLPIIGMGIQMMESHLNFTWASVSLSILVTYIYLESTTGEVDYLTKLFTRQSYELYVINLIEKNLAFEVCLIDLDNFKQINDQYGHVEGDKVLYEFGQVLQKAISPNRMIARLGGDEFIVVVEQISTRITEQEIVLANLQKSSDTALLSLRFSCGWQSFEPGMTMDELYRKVDSEMYKNKQKNKNQNPMR